MTDHPGGTHRPTRDPSSRRARSLPDEVSGTFFQGLALARRAAR